MEQNAVWRAYLLDLQGARDAAPTINLDAGTACAAAIACSAAFAQTAPPAPLKPPSEFQSIANPADRSRAIFAEIGKVLTHPRCMNCHPAGEHPLQGADHHEHKPVVWRSDTGNFGTPCGECHTSRTSPCGSAPAIEAFPAIRAGTLAPLSMACKASRAARSAAS